MEGNPGKRALPEPLLVAGRPSLGELEPPSWLPDMAREFWVGAVARLVEVGLLDRIDAPVLEMLAVQYARWREAGELLAREDVLVESKRGGPRAHPAVKMEREAHLLFLRTAEHFALTPIARTRLGLAELHRRSLEVEMADALGTPELVPVGGGDG